MTYIYIDKSLSIAPRATHIFFDKEVGIRVGLKYGFLLFIGGILKVLRKTLNSSCQRNVSTVISAND